MQDTLSTAGSWPDKIVTAVRWVSMLLILVAALVLIRSLPLEQALAAIKNWIAGLGTWGPVAMALLYVVATVLFVPGTILTLASGALFGLGIGTATVSVGSTAGASLAFLIARYAARDKVAGLAKGNRHFGAIDRAIEEGGWKIVGLLRLSPAIPFNLQNYLYGLTPLKFWPYVLTSWVAMLPGTFLYVYLGHVTGAALGADRQRSIGEWGMLAVGLLATVAVTVYVTRLAKAKLQEQVDESAQVEDSQSLPAGARQASSPSAVGRAVMLAGVAVVLMAMALYVRFNAQQVESWWESLLGTSTVACSIPSQACAAQPIAFSARCRQAVL